ncbi:MAG: DUF2807 domain-containing protein [Sphingobacteriales bacterium JAD_PAG50586_3]|nr:MAG: DUF2807 domain-containing protein [Sphingobacteriales bacterium JAD_PAG50586_3]
MQKALLTISILLAVFGFSCKKENAGDCFKSVGNQAEEMRMLAPFDNIHIDKDVDVVLVPDTQEFAIVRCGENLIDLIKTDISGTKLTITNKNKCNWVRSFKTPIAVEVHVKAIYKLLFTGSGQITCTDTLRSENFLLEANKASGNVDLIVRNGWNEVVQHTGNADLKVGGWAPYNTMYSGGNGFLDCRGMQCKEAYILHKGTGNMYSASTDYLGVKIAFTGDVYYTGTPATIVDTITGSGRLISQ